MKVGLSGLAMVAAVTFSFSAHAQEVDESVVETTENVGGTTEPPPRDAATRG